MQRGFTLIQISLLLVVASLVLVAILPSTRTNLSANSATTVKLNAVLTALRAYESKNAALPCPADASQPILSTTYGVAAANAGTTSNCSGGTPAANYVDSTNHIAVGMVPVRALGLGNDAALDAYGRDITYAVDTNATSCFSGALPGQITVTDNGTANNTIAVLVSHGADGHGAWIPMPGSSGTAVQLNTSSTDTNTLLNAHMNSSFTPTLPLTNFVRAQPTSTFDDLVVYRSNLWTLNSAPLASAPLLPTVATVSGSYYTGQTITFTVTYGGAVTVTGTPELTLSIPQNSGSAATRYASYASSSGSAMTFTYTVQSTDYAPTPPSSVAMTSPILLNGGTISVGGAPGCLNFTPPSLTSILLNPPILYVTDNNGQRVEAFTETGTFLSQIGCSGSSACSSGIANPNETAFDATGNIWVTSTWVLDHYSRSGAFLGTMASGGNGNGKIYYPVGIGVDPGGNVWVAEYGNNRVQKFSSSGTWLLSIPSSGCPDSSTPSCPASSANGAFNEPFGLAVDASGNVWVADTGRGRRESLGDGLL